MKLRRIIFQAACFNTASTAIKILYGIKDMAEMNKTDKIYLHFDLIKELSIAISQILKYKDYQKLFSTEKNEIKSLIIKSLYEQAKNFPACSMIVETKEDGRRHAPVMVKSKNNGLIYNYNILYSYGGELLYQYEKESAVSFPQDLFFNQKNLRKNIASAIKNKYPNLLSCIGVYYSSPSRFLAAVGSSIHTLFGNGNGTQPLLSIINGYVGERLEEEIKLDSPSV